MMEEAVRRYMLAVKDPGSLVNQDAVKELEAKLASETDPIERLTLHASLAQAKAPPMERLEAEFVEAAKPWADDKGVSWQTFVDEGVDRNVLVKAGFEVTGLRRRATTETRPRTRRPRVGPDTVRQAYPTRAGTNFTLKEVQERSGASYGTVRKVVEEDLQEGILEDRGFDTGRNTRGRAPKLYAKVSKARRG